MAVVPAPWRRHREEPIWEAAVRRTLPVLLSAACRASFRVRARGLEHYTGAPSTLVIISHRRDADVVLAAGLLADCRGLRLRAPLPQFVAREDLFRPGFLRDYLDRWPAPLQRAAGLVPLAPLIRACGACPMRRVPERTLGEVLEGLLPAAGDTPLDQVLRPRVVERFERRAGPADRPLTVRRALDDRFRPLLLERYGLMRLRRERLHAVAPAERDAIRHQLATFTRLLEAGHTVMLAPEGVISRDGCISRIRGALAHLVTASRSPVRVLPVGMTYDFMTPGRTTVFIDIGPELEGLAAHGRREIAALAKSVLLRHTTATASQIAGAHLLEIQAAGGTRATAAELDERLELEARRLAGAGAPVDPRLLDPAQRRRRLARLLRYCRRSGALAPEADGRYRLVGSWKDAPPSWQDPRGAFRYAANELHAVRQAWAPRLDPLR